eukprot:TRINITY_DN1397_c0_g1_i1.p2 TRINITY_DN1397_c0_g1~~TRINITY_DN1397_c0_g1_i1.p2  ORF type:complete len:188 (-),score=44.91 TRINITY_DN1397_c0_g1_i1:39-524(-)
MGDEKAAERVMMRAELAAGVNEGEVILTLRNVCSHPIAIYKTAQFPFWNRGIGTRPLIVKDAGTGEDAKINKAADVCAKPGFDYDASRFQVFHGGEAIAFEFDLKEKYHFLRPKTYTVEWPTQSLRGIRGFDNLDDKHWNESQIAEMKIDVSECKTEILFQ